MGPTMSYPIQYSRQVRNWPQFIGVDEDQKSGLNAVFWIRDQDQQVRLDLQGL